MDITREQLGDMYINKKMSGLAIAKLYNTSLGIIYYKLKKYDIKRRTSQEAANLDYSKKDDLILNDTQKQIIDGLMLGDGHITAKYESGMSVYKQHCKYKSVLQNIVNLLSPMRYKISFKKLQNEWVLESHSYSILRKIHRNWYVKAPNGLKYGKLNRHFIKVLPKDLALTPTVVYHWFIGDGTNSNGHIVLCTQGFTKEENLRLVNLLGEIGVKSTLYKSNNIYINAISRTTFFDYIGECKDPDYSYKWVCANKPGRSYNKSLIEVESNAIFSSRLNVVGPNSGDTISKLAVSGKTLSQKGNPEGSLRDPVETARRDLGNSEIVIQSDLHRGDLYVQKSPEMSDSPNGC